MRRACVLCASLLCCRFPRTWPACHHVDTQHQANILFTLHTALFTPCTSRFTLALHTPQFISSQDIQFLRTTKLAQSTSQYYFVLQSLHKVLPSTTSYYKARTNYFPVLLHTTKLAQSTSQYYFVIQSLYKVLPSTSSYYKACTQYFPVLLRTTKLAQNISSHYFAFSFRRSNLILCEKVATDNSKSQFYCSFWRSNLISCEKVAFRAASSALPPALREK